jgi:4-hydroxy-2-oxoheptanedioate aldolase
MDSSVHLNGAVSKLDAGGTVFASFAPADIGNAQAMAAGPYDVVVFEMEHNPFDVASLRGQPAVPPGPAADRRAG